jgi:hypothetical protein
MAPAKTLARCGAGWVLRGEGMRSIREQSLRADVLSKLPQLDTGSGQNGDMRCDELLALSAIVDGGLRPDSELAFDLGVGVDNELEFVGTLVTIQ